MADILTTFKQNLPFPLDDFQEDAIEKIHEGRSVVVCAPTGAGKTVIAEFAATKALSEYKKLIYTTPLKALSNQKFHDLKQQFSEDQVGLLTGDTSTNREARIVVMTTEVFRNLLYGLNEDRNLIRSVGYVVLDECHFMNDADRGTVWEESLIYCPDEIQVIALSATVANAEELTRWIDHIHPDCDLVWSDFRPVPLHFYYYHKKHIVPLFEGTTKKLNGRLKDERAVAKGSMRGPKGGMMFDPAQMLDEMNHKDMLPAIVFIFSRKGCDKAMKECMHLDLTSFDEKEAIKGIIAQLRQTITIDLEPWVEQALIQGLASHHAGLLPATKYLVETLFQTGMLKAVFATETLAAGINMPARSTVVTSISKRSDEGHRTLKASEFLQMSGRAGRRGMDTLGHVVVVHSPFHDAAEVGKLATSPPDALNSQFTATYGMVLNLLQKFDLDRAGFLVSKSFGAYTTERRTKPLNSELTERKDLLDEALHFPCPHSLTLDDFRKHLKDRVRMSNLNRNSGILIRNQKRHGSTPELADEINKVEHERAALSEALDIHVCTSCELFKKHRRAEERVDRLNRQVTRLQTEVEAERNVYWQNFLNLATFLRSLNYLDENNKPTHAGLITSKIRTENEVFFAQAVMTGVFDELEPEQLAAVISAMVNDSNRQQMYSQLRYSRPVRKTLEAVDRIARFVDKEQRKHNIALPMHINPSASAIVEAWARGTSWSQLTQMTTHDAGDLVRNIRRTADILRQLSKIHEIPPSLAYTAHQALLALYRDPVKELEIRDDDLKPKNLADFEASAEAAANVAKLEAALAASPDAEPSRPEPMPPLMDASRPPASTEPPVI
jgi:superfamily II RNA helicase